jgi:steroid delta-isomerase-like uncharacterized protein
MIQQEINKTVVRAYAEAFSRGDFDEVRKIFTQDAIVQGVLGHGGLDVALPVWRSLHEAFAVQIQIEDLIAEGDLVAARYSESGIFRAPFRGMQPTGKSYRLVAMGWFRMRDGKITERWGARDSASMQKQLGGTWE